MNHMQAIINQISMDNQAERAETQLTLGGLIAILEKMPADLHISGLGEVSSYRGYYTDLAFDPDDAPKLVPTLLHECKEAMGQPFQGYKGGTFYMCANTPLWVARYGEGGLRLLGIRSNGTPVTAEEDDD